jgi:hypothetical protein
MSARAIRLCPTEGQDIVTGCAHAVLTQHRHPPAPLGDRFTAMRLKTAAQINGPRPARKRGQLPIRWHGAGLRRPALLRSPG